MLKTKVQREGAFTPIPKSVRKKCERKACEICSAVYGSMRCKEGRVDRLIWVVEHLHHLLARRWLVERGIDPHVEANFISVCAECHGKCKKAEDRLFQGDVFAFLSELKQVGIPIDRVVRFASAVGLAEFSGWNL